MRPGGRRIIPPAWILFTLPERKKAASGCLFNDSATRSLLAEAGDEAGHCLDLAVAHVGSDRLHHARCITIGVIDALGGTDIATASGAERLQLRLDVLGVLAAQCREACGVNALARRAVTTRAGRHTGFQVTTAVETLTGLDQRRVCLADLDRLPSVKRRQIGHVLLGQTGYLALHDGVLALAALEVHQLLERVLGALASNFRDGRGGTVAVLAMARLARSRFLLTSGGIAFHCQRRHAEQAGKQQYGNLAH